MRRPTGNGYATSVRDRHAHALPSGESWSTPQNDRACVPHTIGDKITCAVDGCEKFMGHHCIDCDRVV